MTAPTTIRYDVVDGIGHLVLARPQRGNALDQVALDELDSVVRGAEADPQLRCLLVSAEGRFFCTGGDLRALGASREGAPDFVRGVTTALNSMVARLAGATAPVVVATRAPAIGAGVCFAAVADVVIASDTASFVAGYPALGLTPDAGLSWLLPRRVGQRAAASYFLRDQTWTARQALALGLVGEVVADDDLDARALAVATEIATGSTPAHLATRALLLSGSERTLSEQLEREAASLASAVQTEDGWHGITEVLAGRVPSFPAPPEAG
ncbi:MAG: Enoyl-CoA hydratase/isomerase [Nocardioides sp.]|nr:Enoyl-CoA hydratase/isomerase [Nocardioides sp.]